MDCGLINVVIHLEFISVSQYFSSKKGCFSCCGLFMHQVHLYRINNRENLLKLITILIGTLKFTLGFLFADIIWLTYHHPSLL